MDLGYCLVRRSMPDKLVCRDPPSLPVGVSGWGVLGHYYGEATGYRAVYRRRSPVGTGQMALGAPHGQC